jgi:hypothetical protein
MSGQPINNVSDENKFRNEYMQNLELASEIADTNLQANKNYLLTGQLPTISQMIDTRTTTEKLEDINKLKQDIIDKMAPIADAATASAIVNKVISNPLNVSNSLFRFMAQRIGEIVTELSKIYPYGIAYEPSDIDGIVLVIQNMYSETQGKITSFRSYMNTTSSTTAGTQVVSADNLSQIITQLQHISRVLITLRLPVIFNDKLTRLIAITRQISQSLPTSNLMSLLNKYITGAFIPGIMEKLPGAFGINIMGQPMPGEPAIPGQNVIANLTQNQLAIIKPFFKLVEKLPKLNAINTLITKLNKYMDIRAQNPMGNNNDANKHINDCLDGLLNLFSAFETDDARGIMTQFQNTMLPILENVNHVSGGFDDAMTKMGAYENQIIKMGNMQVPLTPVQERNVQHLTRERDRLRDEVAAKYGQGISQPKKRVGRPRGAGIVKVEKPPNYIGFGINEINRKKMNEKNILTIRRNNSRTNIPDLPSRHISDGFKNVLNTIVGGGTPKFNDMSKLTEEEQEYLYKLVSKSNLEDKLSVPAPSKDSLDKDFHEFEKMKGEILSGNDSRELVKKFKGLIMKLSRNGYLPKPEVNELLELLSSLSY